MYAETGLMFPYFQNFSHEIQQFDDFYCSQKPNASSVIPSTVVEPSTISDYNIWEEGDLFKAPQPVIEEPSSLMGIDPMTAAISMISCGEDVISTQSLTVSDIESSIESGQLLSEVFYECRKDLLAKEGNETPLSEVLNINIPGVVVKADENFPGEGPFQKSVSLRSLTSMEAPLIRPNFLDFPVMDFGSVYGMRRAFSEGDIKTLDNNCTSHSHSPVGPLKAISSCTTSDVRREKLSRYWSKKSKRNFGRKIKYACRKALADSQPRIRGRFAKTEEMEVSKKE
ncbi:hypothetical protein ABFX02_06G022500 [Erythranthe guttata]